MLYYARSDTHYLLYIYDRVRNELVDRSNRSDPETDLINSALERSRELSLSRYDHPDYSEATGEGSRGWYNHIMRQGHLALNSEQFAVFRALWRWRDDTARKEDESPNFVLGTSNVFEIARVNPPDAKALHSLLPLTAPLARARLNDIWSRLQDEKARGGLSLLQFFMSLSPDAQMKKSSVKPLKDKSPLPLSEGAEVSVDRMSTSKLFGNMPLSSRWEEPKNVSTNLEESIPFPWQRFVENFAVVAEASDEQDKDQIMQEPPPIAEPSAKNEEVLQDVDEEFTLRRGRKRKSETDPDEDAISSSGDDDDDDDDEPAQSSAIPAADINDVIAIEERVEKKSKKQRKLERKQRREEAQAEEEEEEDGGGLERYKKRQAKLTRKAKKQKKMTPEADDQKKYQAVPFDYSTAATVMHAGKNKSQQAREPKKVFDPYSKTADDGIKGARKMPPVRGERSATFKK